MGWVVRVLVGVLLSSGADSVNLFSLLVSVQGDTNLDKVGWGCRFWGG